MSLLRGENDLKQSDEFQASLTVFLPEITYKHLIASCIEYIYCTHASVFCTVEDISDDLAY